MGKLANRADKRTTARKPTRAASAGNGASTAKSRARRKPTLREMNRWITEHHDQIVAAAQENCRHLTGKPTL